MRKLYEKEHEDFLSPKTMAKLKSKSGEKEMLRGKDLGQAMVRSTQLVSKVTQIESEYVDELSDLAVIVVKENFPIIEEAGIEIDAKIVPMSDIQIPEPPPEDDPTSPTFDKDGDLDKKEAKRNLINSIQQGASVRGAFSFLTSDLFESYIEAIDPELLTDYVELLNLSFGIYDDEQAIQMLLNLIAKNKNMPGGESKMEWDDDAKRFVIKARAICFPMLVHEIVKGLYEVVGQEGFTSDAEKNKAIVKAADKLSNEPRGLQYGKFIYDDIRDIYNKSDIRDGRVPELFLKALYGLEDDALFSFVDNAVNNELTTGQKKWANETMKNLEVVMKRRDAKRALKNQGGQGGM